MANRDIPLSYRDGQGYSLNKGKYRNDQGELKYRRWWLGQSKDEAQRLAQMIVAEWSLLKARGIGEWSADTIQRLEAEKHGIRATEVARVNHADGVPISSPSATTKSPITLYQAMQKWLDARKAEVKANQIGDDQHGQDIYAVARIKKNMPDAPLHSIGQHEIKIVVQHFISRPISEQTKRPHDVSKT